MGEFRAEEHNPRTMILPEKKPVRRRGLWIFVGILGALIVLVTLSVSITDQDKHSYATKEPYIAKIYVNGVIQEAQADAFSSSGGYQHQWTLDQIDYLISDPHNKGILLFINSPGGGVYESDALYLKLKEYRETTKRPLYASMGSMAASGGYYVAAPADKIFANRNTWTGSIGVTMGTMYDVSGLLERFGVKTQTITAGTNKAMGSAVEPMTAEQRAIFQSLVDDAYEQFVGIVAEERGLPIEETKKLADGRIYTSKQALGVKLIDAIGTDQEALADMQSKYSLSDCKEVEVLYEEDSFLSGLLLKVVPHEMKMNSDLGVLLSIVKQGNPFPVSYLCDYLK